MPYSEVTIKNTGDATLKINITNPEENRSEETILYPKETLLAYVCEHNVLELEQTEGAKCPSNKDPL